MSDIRVPTMASTRSQNGSTRASQRPAASERDPLEDGAVETAATDATATEADGDESGLPAPTDPELLAELPTFEQFFKTFGFKRMQGRVWGLLVLSSRPLSCREICDTLEISQGAASTTLTELTEWGAIQSTFDSARRCHLHSPVGNALQIAATILRRREQVAFQSFRQTIGRALEIITRKHGDRDPRVLTLRSIISACDIADAMMKLLVGAVANALGDGQSILSRAISAAFKVGLGEPGRLLTQLGPNSRSALAESAAATGPGEQLEGSDDATTNEDGAPRA
jgi:DNA-binding transcriptional regulator GbsR (MarR family)